jgi:hypothetical protein
MTIKDIIDKLGIDETFTKPPKKTKKFTKIKDSVTQLEGYNYMADILYLPEDKTKNKYLLVITDLISHACDFEAVKNLKAETILNAMKTIFKRKYLDKPNASLRTDNGSEFKGVFHKYLHDNDIFHSVSLPYRHTQLSAVERLNKTLGRILNGFMNTQEIKTGEVSKDWVHILPILRDELNKTLYVKPKYTDMTIYKESIQPINNKNAPKYKVGDLVHRQLDYPENALGNKQSTHNFRMGDFRFSPVPQKITKILYFNGSIPYRYMLDGIKNASFTEAQLMPSVEKVQKWKVKKIIGHKKIKNKIHFLIWWKGLTKRQSTYEPRSELIKDIPKLIKDYESTLK